MTPLDIQRLRLRTLILDKKLQACMYRVQTVYIDTSHSRETFQDKYEALEFYKKKCADTDVMFCQLVMKSLYLPVIPMMHYYKHMDEYIRRGQPYA